MKIEAKWVNITPSSFTVSTKTSAFTAADKFIYLVNTTSGTVAIQLPAPSAGLQFMVKDSKQMANVNAITLVRASSEKIEEIAATYTLNDIGVSATIVSDGTDWFIL